MLFNSLLHILKRGLEWGTISLDNSDMRSFYSMFLIRYSAKELNG